MSIPQPGDNGPEVKKLQNRLIELGYKLPKFGADGDYGDETVKAVRMWQQEYHIDGSLDESEMAALFEPEPNTSKAVGDFVTPPHGQKGLVERYGKPWHDTKGWWNEWCGTVVLPDPLKRLTKYGKIYVNKDIVPVLNSVFDEICAAGLADEIKTYNGCFNVRKVRGKSQKQMSTWSTHSWGMAIDINAATNGLGMKPQLHPGVVQIFEGHDFVWGGRFGRLDSMHFQYVTGM